MNSENHKPSLSMSPVVISRGAYFDSHKSENIQKLSKESRVNTLLRSGSLTDFTGPWTPQYVLSLDGGGIKGYSSLLILQRLMNHIEAEEERLGPDRPQPWYNDNLPQQQHPFEPCYYFDYVFGTSTGGLIAIMLGRLRMSVNESLEAYRDLAGKVFAQPKWFSLFGLARDMYDHRELRKAVDEVVQRKRERNRVTEPVTSEEPDIDEVQAVLLNQPDEPRMDGVQKTFGGALNSDATFNSDPTMCRTVCVAYAGIEDSKEYPFLFRSYEHIANTHSWALESGSVHSASMIDDNSETKWWVWQRNPSPAHALPIWQVARATTAATGYFRPMTIGDIDFVDGALGCNNPAREAYHEVVQMHNGNPKAVKLLLSIGTGQSEVTRIGRGRVGRMLQAGRAAVGYLTGTEETHNVMVEIARAVDFTYKRFNVPKTLGVGQMRMDLWNEDVRRSIEEKTEEYLNKPGEDDRLKEIAAMLVKARRERAATRRWPISTSQVRYRCTIENCDNGQKVRNTFDDLWNHIVNEHMHGRHPRPTRATATQQEREIIERIINSGQILH